MSPTSANPPPPRGISPVVGVVLLVAITVALAAIVVAAAGTWSIDDPGPTAAFDLSVDADRSEIVIEHTAGDPIDVNSLEVVVEVNGDPLEHQPPVPFVGASGFYETPDGPFNAERDSKWGLGDRTSFRVAETNEPGIESGDTVSVALSSEGQPVATLEATAR